MKHFLMNMFLCLLFTSHMAIAQPEEGVASWYLPRTLSDQNTKIRFELDSTWHLVHGTTKGVSGLAKLAEEKNPSSVQIELELPVSAFDTDNSSRDEKMRKVMSAEQFPYVRFKSTGISGRCTPALVLRDKQCIDSLQGELTILQTSSPVTIPVIISSLPKSGFKVEGKLPLKWSDYGVEDPSILIARVDSLVTVFFEVELSPKA